MNFQTFFSRRTLILMVSVSFIVLLQLMLISWSPTDQSLFYLSSETAPIQNLFGFIGAQIAALCYFITGIAALLIPALLAFTLYCWYTKRWHDEWDRLLAAILGCMATAAACNFWHIGFLKDAPLYGGLVGKSIVALLRHVLPQQIVALALVSWLFSSLIVVTRMGILHLMAFVARYSAWAAYVLSGACIRSAWYVLRESFYWLRDAWRGTPFASIELLLSQAERDEYDALADLDNDPFWQQFKATGDDKPVEAPQAIEPAVACGSVYVLPDLAAVQHDRQSASYKKNTNIASVMAQLQDKLLRLGIQGSVRTVKEGPVVTMFEFEPAADSKLSKIVGLEDDIALALSAHSVRIIAPIPGTSCVGIEVANKERDMVMFLSLASQQHYTQSKHRLPLILGVDTTGTPVMVDLASLPHLLVAGSTGSGKSVALTTMLISLLGKLTPDHMRLVLIDPKRLEFAGFADIPHLLFPIVTQPQEAVKVLQWLVRHMEERYEKMAAVGAKNIRDYNASQSDTMPSIVVFIDELADLMMTAGKQVEDSLARLAQMARAAGIHLIVATQRPSVDVITGLIKVNFPSRIAFRVTSKVDSRTILDECGAEKLLGKGDMLFMDATGMRRVHGCFLSDDALKTIIHACKKQGTPAYISFESSSALVDDGCDENDVELYKQVEEFVMTLEEVSISLVQRKFRIGYNRSARIVELLQQRGRISSSEGARMKKVIRSGQVEK